jgi:hypothetical protein
MTKSRRVSVPTGGHEQRSAQVVGFAACCQLIGLSRRSGERYLASGLFPIPALKRITPRAPHRFALRDIDAYLDSSLDDARVNRSRRTK